LDLGSLTLQGAAAGELAVLVVVSFLPPVLFAVWIRNTEKYAREPLSHIGRLFVWGAAFAIVFGALLSLLLFVLFQSVTPVGQLPAIRGLEPSSLVLALVVAPFAEEFAKAFVFLKIRRTLLLVLTGILVVPVVLVIVGIALFFPSFALLAILVGVLVLVFIYLAATWPMPNLREAEDGFVYGATSGLGFSATENLLYGIVAFAVGGLIASIALIAIRSVSSSFLHASATGLTGYGIGRQRLWGSRFPAWPWYFAAVGMHAAFNALASFGVVLSNQYGEAGGLLVLVAAVVFASVTITLVRGKIMEHDAGQGWVP
jgi:protease PrsW